VIMCEKLTRDPGNPSKSDPFDPLTHDLVSHYPLCPGVRGPDTGCKRLRTL